MQYVVGDIHGCYYTLKKLISKIKLEDAEAKFVFVGDYVDRGLHSAKAVDYVIELQKEGAICLRGNHDDVVDYLLNEHSMSDPGEWVAGRPELDNVLNWSRCNGIEDALDSYGVDHTVKEGMYGQIFNHYEIVDDFRQKAEHHKEFFRNLELFWENDTHFACHGYYPFFEELKRDKRFIPSSYGNTILWSRFEADPRGGLSPNVKPVWDKIGIFGHTPVQVYQHVVGIKYKNIRLVDTMAFDDNYLSAYCCERDEFVQVATELADIDKHVAKQFEE